MYENAEQANAPPLLNQQKNVPTLRMMPNEGVVSPEESKCSGYRSESPVILVQPVLQFLPNIRERVDAIKKRRIPR
jgi:hypothetical protein